MFELTENEYDCSIEISASNDRFEKYLCNQQDRLNAAGVKLNCSITGKRPEDVESEDGAAFAAVESVSEFCADLGMEIPCNPFYEEAETPSPEEKKLNHGEGVPCWYLGCERTEAGYDCPFFPQAKVPERLLVTDYDEFLIAIESLSVGAPAACLYKNADTGACTYFSENDLCSFIGNVTEVQKIPASCELLDEELDQPYDVAGEYVWNNGNYAVGITRIRPMRRPEFESLQQRCSDGDAMTFYC